MLRALSFREYRKSFVVHAAILGTLLFLLEAFERLAPRFGLGGAVDPLVFNQLLIVGLVASGLMSGERGFSASFKGGRYSFWTALPVPRILLWAALCLPRLLGAWTAILSFLGLRLALTGGLPADLPPGMWALLATASSFLAAHATAFLTGAALALALRREISVYVVGPPFLAFLATTTLANLAYGFDLGFPDSIGLIQVRVTALAVLLALSMAAIGAWLFVRGELGRWRQRLDVLALLVLLAAGHLVATHLLALNRSMARWGDAWIRPQGRFDWFRISPDGQFVAVWQRLRYRGVLSRFEVLDARSGSTVGSHEMFLLISLEWSGTGKTLNAIAADSGEMLRCVWLPCPEEPRWLRFTPAARKVAQMDLGSVGDIYSHPGTTDRFLIDRDGEQTIAYRVGDQGLPQEVWKGPSRGSIEVEQRMSGPNLTRTIGPGTIKAWGLKLDKGVDDPSDETLSFDPGRSLPASVRCSPSEERLVDLEWLHSGRALVRFACGRGGIWRSRFFLYRSESNQLREIAGLPRDLPLDVAWHHLTDDGFLLWSVSGQEIWSLTPGRTPLRIWPPA
jgi:hypothetical protein